MIFGELVWNTFLDSIRLCWVCLLALNGFPFEYTMNMTFLCFKFCLIATLKLAFFFHNLFAIIEVFQFEWLEWMRSWKFEMLYSRWRNPIYTILGSNILPVFRKENSLQRCLLRLSLEFWNGKVLASVSGNFRISWLYPIFDKNACCTSTWGLLICSDRCCVCVFFGGGVGLEGEILEIFLATLAYSLLLKISFNSLSKLLSLWRKRRSCKILFSFGRSSWFLRSFSQIGTRGKIVWTPFWHEGWLLEYPNCFRYHQLSARASWSVVTCRKKCSSLITFFQKE